MWPELLMVCVRNYPKINTDTTLYTVWVFSNMDFYTLPHMAGFDVGILVSSLSH